MHLILGKVTLSDQHILSTQMQTLVLFSDVQVPQRSTSVPIYRYPLDLRRQMLVIPLQPDQRSLSALMGLFTIFTGANLYPMTSIAIATSPWLHDEVGYTAVLALIKAVDMTVMLCVPPATRRKELPVWNTTGGRLLPASLASA